MAANIFTGATNNSWGTASNWSLGTVPTATDGHIVTFNATSPNCTVDVSDKVCNNIDFTGYTNTINMLFRITVSGNVTLGSTMLIIGTGALRVNRTGTLTSNGKQWNRPLIFSTTGAAMTFTIVGDWYVTNLTCGDAGAASHTLNSTAGAKIYVSGNLNKAGTAPSMSGNTEIVLNGSGTWSNPTANTAALFGNPITIDSPGGNITITGFVNFASVGGTGTLKHLNGTVTCSGTFFISNATLNTNDQIPFSTLQLGNGVTLTSNAVTTNLTFNGGPGNVNINGFRINISGNLAATNSTVGGTTKFVMIGTGTWSSSGGLGNIGNDLEFNTTGTVSVTGTVYWGSNGRTLSNIANTGTVNFGTSTLQFRAANINLNLNTLSVWNLTTGGATITYTLLSNLNIGGLFTISNQSVITINGAYNINCSGGLFFNSISNAILIGGIGSPPSLYILGGSWSQSGAGTLGVNTFINGNVTIGSGPNMSVEFGGNANSYTLTYLGGSVTTTGSTIRCRRATLNTSGIPWNNFTFTATGTSVLGQDLNINGLFSITSAHDITGPYTINAAGGLFLSNSFNSPDNSVLINLTGGTWSAANSSSEVIMRLQINGNVTVTGTVYYRGYTLSYTGIGSVNTGTSTLSIGGNATLNTNGITWYNISVTNISTITINSLLTVAGTMTLPAAAVTFAGSAGFNVGVLSIPSILSANINITLQSLITYNINNAFNSTGGTSFFKYTIKSSTPSVKAILTLNQAATQNIVYINATDINSSLGQTIYTINGTLSNTDNWNILTGDDIGTNTFIFIR